MSTTPSTDNVRTKPTLLPRLETLGRIREDACNQADGADDGEVTLEYGEVLGLIELAELAHAQAAELAAMREAMLAPIQLADACLGHLKQRDWFKEGVKDEVVCALNADLVRLTLAKLQPFTDPEE